MEALPIKLTNIDMCTKTEVPCESGVLENIESVKHTAKAIIQAFTSNHWSTSYPSAITWTLAKDKENYYQHRVEAMPGFTMLCEVLKTGEQLIKLCDNQIFVKEFFLNGGLSLLMRIISGEGVHDVRKILLASIKIFLTLGDTTEDIKSHRSVVADVCQNALGGLPRLIKMTSDSDHLVQLGSLTLINLVLEYADKETGDMMIKKLTGSPNAQDSDLWEVMSTTKSTEVSLAISKQAETLKEKIKSSRVLPDESCKAETILFHEECKSNLSFLDSLGKSQTLPNMRELVQGLASIPVTKDGSPGLPGSNQMFHEKKNLLTFLETLIKSGISGDPEGIEVLLVGSNRKRRKKLAHDIADANGQIQMNEEDLQSFSDAREDLLWGENATAKGPRSEEGTPIELSLTHTGTFLVSIDVPEDLESEGSYHRLIGNYIDMIDRVTSATGIKPKVALATTATENLNKPRCFDNLLKTTKAHLEYLEVDHVLENSVLSICPGGTESLQKIKKLSLDTNIVTKLFRCRPHLWEKFLEEMKRRPFVTIDGAKTMLNWVEEDLKDAAKGSKTEIVNLAKMSKMGMFMMRIPIEKETTSDEAVMEEGEEEDPLLNLSNPKLKIKKDVEVVLEFLQDKGEILWCKNTEKLKDLIITQPEKLRGILSTLSSRQNIQKIKSVEFESAKDILSRKGLISYQAFTAVYDKLINREEDFSVAYVWEIMAELGLICPLKKDSEMCGFIPSLISSKTTEKILRAEVDMEKDPDSVCLQFVCLKNRDTQGMYFKFLKDFSRAFLWGEMGGEILFSSSQKLEGRQLGTVGGIHGVLKWHEEGVLEPQEFLFLILEWEGTLNSSHLEDSPHSKAFARHRAIKILLRPEQGGLRASVLEILSKVNDVVSESLGPVRRLLSCKLCQMLGEPGFFELKEDLQLLSEYEQCSELEHRPERKILQLKKDSANEKPFELTSLMKIPKANLELEQFQTSHIKRNMLKGRLKVGEQIWIHHDAESDPFNPVARMNPYAHVVVYVGQREVGGQMIHEVVHVLKKSMSGFAKASVVREDVMKVIRPHEQVFLGHKINKVQYAGNIREKIAERALACCREPGIVFDYDHR